MEYINADQFLQLFTQIGRRLEQESRDAYQYIEYLRLTRPMVNGEQLSRKFQLEAKDDPLKGLEKAMFEDIESSEMCPICMEDFCVGTKLVITTCSHKFHETCLMEWLSLKRTCPCCRSEI